MFLSLNLTALALLIVDSITMVSSTSGNLDSKFSSYFYRPPDFLSSTKLTLVLIGLKGRNFIRNVITSVDFVTYSLSGFKFRYESIICLLSSGYIKLHVNSVLSPSLIPSKLVHLTTSSSSFLDWVRKRISVFSLFVSVIPTIGYVHLMSPILMMSLALAVCNDVGEKFSGTWNMLKGSKRISRFSISLSVSLSSVIKSKSMLHGVLNGFLKLMRAEVVSLSLHDI
mmetsp:Transcript_25268/g.21156  ORF Transcript_25268/g.21156 Transcript_25268/m.21156 type:complete len:226 (-) Transcript_25268:5131-5808(-)